MSFHSTLKLQILEKTRNYIKISLIVSNESDESDMT